ncbi:MAG: multiheme c-type cytochrome [Deltaproteobacteria bacterium]|nr:multiheme c-type cytochrome [Deltaproteobacteria bacterium]
MRAGRAATRVALIVIGLVLPARGDISGRVRRGDTLAPLAGVRVHLQAQPTPLAITDGEGRFTLPVAPAGEVVVSAALPYDAAAAVSFETGGATASDGQRAVDIRLAPIPDASNPDYEPIKAAMPGGCGDCHSQQLGEWQGSHHAGAAVDTWVLDLFSGSGTPGGSAGYVYRATHDAGETGFCATCHAPVAEARAPGTVYLDEVSGDAAREGVTCSACHQIDEVNENVAALHLLGNATMRFPLAGAGGSGTHEYVWGPLDDVDYAFMRASYQPRFAESRFCASCHQYDNPDTGAPGQHTYSEWLASPYAVPGDGFRTCQDCHMPEATSAGPLADAIGGGDITRPAAQRHLHTFIGSTPATLAAAIELRLAAHLDGAALVVEASVDNHGAGHSFPTGVSIRNALLVVEATAGDAALARLDGPTVPWWADDDVAGVQEGDYAGQPGLGFAKILAGRINGSGAETMPVLFIDAERVESDTAIAAGATASASWRFALPDGTTEAQVGARLLYRRAFRALAVTKGWTVTPAGGPIEIEVARAERTVPIAVGFCAGDCNGDGAVTVDELVTAVSIALGSAGLERCSAVNTAEDTVVTISELIAAVNAALGGCPDD